MYDNQPVCPRLKVRILSYSAHANEVIKADYHTYNHRMQSTPNKTDNSNLQGKLKKVQVIGSSS